MSNKQNDSAGVSPVIGIILMVAVTVALVALATVTVFDLGGDVSELPDATVQFDETDSTISARVLRNENVESLKLIAPDGSEIGATSTVGDSIEDSNKQTGNYQIVAEMPDGNEEVLTITSIESTSGGGGEPFSSPSQSAPSDISAVSFDGGDGSKSDPYVIMNDQQLQALENDKSAHYILGQNIDASGTTSWNGGDGFNPIGDFANNFTGSLDGDDYVIDGLYINRPSNNHIALIGSSKGSITNIGVVNANVTGNNRVGGLVGYIDEAGTVGYSYSTGSVSSDSGNTGGLVAENVGTVEYSYAKASVSVTGSNEVVGGLVGVNSGTVSESYATGDVNGGGSLGGLVGNNAGTVEYSYSTGSVSGTTESGLAANNPGNIMSSYWDTESSGQSSSAGGTGLTTSEMQGDSYNTDFKSDIVDNSAFTGVTGDYPELAWQSE